MADVISRTLTPLTPSPEGLRAYVETYAWDEHSDPEGTTTRVPVPLLGFTVSTTEWDDGTTGPAVEAVVVWNGHIETTETVTEHGRDNERRGAYYSVKIEGGEV